MPLPCIIISFFFFNETPSSQSQDAIKQIKTVTKSEPEIQHSATDNTHNPHTDNNYYKTYSYSRWNSFDIKFESDDDETPKLPSPKQAVIRENNRPISNPTPNERTDQKISEYVNINVNQQIITNSSHLNSQSNNVKQNDNNIKNINNDPIKASEDCKSHEDGSENGVSNLNLKDSEAHQTHDNGPLNSSHGNVKCIESFECDNNELMKIPKTSMEHRESAELYENMNSDMERLFQIAEQKTKPSIDENRIILDDLDGTKAITKIDTKNVKNKYGLLRPTRGNRNNKKRKNSSHMVVKTGRRESLFNPHHERNSTKQLKRGVTCVNDVTNKARSSELRRKGYLLKLYKEEQNALDKQRELDKLKKNESQSHFD